MWSYREVLHIARANLPRLCRQTGGIVLAAFSGIAGFLFGVDTGNISGALPYITDELLQGYSGSRYILSGIQLTTLHLAWAYLKSWKASSNHYHCIAAICMVSFKHG